MIEAIKKTLGFMSIKEKVIYFFLVFTRAFSSFLDVLGIVLIAVITGLAAASFDTKEPPALLGFQLPIVTQETLVLLVLAVLGVFTVKAAVAISLGKAIATFLAKLESEKAREIANFFFSGSLSNLNRFDKGEITWASMGSATIAFNGLLTSLSTFISEGLLLILVTVTLFIADPVASMFVVIYFGLIIAIIQLAIGKALKMAGRDLSEGSIASMVAIEDSVSAFREIAVLNKKDFFLKAFSEARTRTARSNSIIIFLGGMPRYVVETALMLGVVIFVGYQFLTGQLATGLITVGVFLTGGVRIMASLLPLQNAIANVKIQVEQSQLAHQVLGEVKKSTVTSSPPSTTKSEVSGLGIVNNTIGVSMRNVSFSYPDSDSLAIKNVSLEITPGSHVALIGPSGAGKTTIVDLILGLLEPTDGVLEVGGVKNNHRSLIEKGLVSYVPQSPGIVSGTIAENVALGISVNQIDAELVWEALHVSHLDEFVKSLPKGIFSSVGNQADALSGGQIQRLGLARALYNKPKLIILDEATSALDAKSESFISESLKDLGKDVTVIVIAHRLSTVQKSDKVFVIDGGKLAAAGTFSFLRENVPMIAEYVKLMSFDDNVITGTQGDIK